MRFARTPLSFLVVAIALLLAANFPSAVLADSKTKLIGNSSGTPFTAACPPENVLVGWGYNATDHLTAIAPLCAAVVDGKLSGAPVASPKNVYGSDDPAAFSGAPVICPDQGFMRQLTVALTSTLRVHHIRPTCKAENHAPVILRPTTTNGGESTAESNVSCKSGSFATGMIGTFGDSLRTGGVMSLGLICFSPSSPKPDEPKPDDTANTDTDNPDTADTGDDKANANGFPFRLQITIGPDGLNFGPKGNVRVLAEASTLYSDRGNTEIAYLDKGDKVTVLGCEKKGKGWCQVIKPQPGLIWGGDLKK